MTKALKSAAFATVIGFGALAVARDIFARAVRFGTRILIDEPTSALGVRQTSNVLATIDKVRKQGIGVVFISHNVRHALAAGDRFAILNRGKAPATANRGEISPEELRDLTAGGPAGAKLEGSLGGTV